LSTLALLVPANAFARGTFDPTTEFVQDEWIPIHVGPINLSITKAGRLPDARHAADDRLRPLLHARDAEPQAGAPRDDRELVYDVAQQQSRSRACRTRRSPLFPYVATLMLFHLHGQLARFIPLPLTVRPARLSGVGSTPRRAPSR